MPRPRMHRKIHGVPGASYFKPQGIPLTQLGEVGLMAEEYEAIRLADALQLTQIACAKRMGISQPTFNRIISSAHRKIADAMVNGKAIRMEGR